MRLFCWSMFMFSSALHVLTWLFMNLHENRRTLPKIPLLIVNFPHPVSFWLCFQPCTIDSLLLSRIIFLLKCLPLLACSPKITWREKCTTGDPNLHRNINKKTKTGSKSRTVMQMNFDDEEEEKQTHVFDSWWRIWSGR